MNATTAPLVSPVFSWPIEVLPPTLFDLVGGAQERARGIDFGQLKPEIGYEGQSLMYPRSLELNYRLGYKFQEPIPYPAWWEGFDDQKRATLKWRFHDLPTRLSFLLANARWKFPGVGFQMIGLSVELEEQYLVLTNLLPEMMSRRLVV
jgi:hypothetical protein